MVIFRHFNLVIDFCISARNSINNHFFTRCPLTKSFSMLFNSTRNNPQTRMFCYTYNPLLILSTNFFIVLCILCMGRGTCALAYVIRSSGLFVTVFPKNIFGFPQTVCRIFPFICAQTDAQKRYSRSEMRTREKTQAML